jgi:hypothetical protein
MNSWHRYDDPMRYEGWCCTEIMRTCPQIHAEVTNLLFRNCVVDVDLTKNSIAFLIGGRCEEMREVCYARFLRRFDFTRPRQVNVKLHVRTFRNPLHVLRWREMVSGFVEILGRRGGKIHNLRIEIVGDGIEGFFVLLEKRNQYDADRIDETRLSNVLQRSFPGQAPDLVLVLGPFSLLYVEGSVDISLRSGLRTISDEDSTNSDDLSPTPKLLAFDRVAKSLKRQLESGKPCSISSST